MMKRPHGQAEHYERSQLGSPHCASRSPSNALSGRQDEAEAYMHQLRELDPKLRIGNLSDRLPAIVQAGYRTDMEEGLRKAGLPK